MGFGNNHKTVADLWDRYETFNEHCRGMFKDVYRRTFELENGYDSFSARIEHLEASCAFLECRVTKDDHHLVALRPEDV